MLKTELDPRRVSVLSWKRSLRARLRASGHRGAAADDIPDLRGLGLLLFRQRLHVIHHAGELGLFQRTGLQASDEAQRDGEDDAWFHRRGLGQTTTHKVQNFARIRKPRPVLAASYSKTGRLELLKA